MIMVGSENVLGGMPSLKALNLSMPDFSGLLHALKRIHLENVQCEKNRPGLTLRPILNSCTYHKTIRRCFSYILSPIDGSSRISSKV